VNINDLKGVLSNLGGEDVGEDFLEVSDAE
jgi:hypothetical protein